MTNRARIPRNGKTIREVAEGTGLSTATIERWTSAPRADYLAQANAKRERVQELHAKGLSMRAIAAEIGCSVGLVHRYVKEVEEKKTA
jgi:transposase